VCCNAIKSEGLSPVKPKFDRTGRDKICWVWLTGRPGNQNIHYCWKLVRVQLQLFANCCYLLQEGPIVPCITGDALGRGEPFTSTAGSMREV
jgi:hypothetical protein